jgi:hypothetical protein
VLLLPLTLAAPLLRLAQPYHGRALALYLTGWLLAAALLLTDAAGLITWPVD